MDSEDTRITICISKAILESIENEAQAIGVSVYDMIRFVLGERFKAYGVKHGSSSLPLPLPLFPPPAMPDYTTLFRETNGNEWAAEV